MTFQEKLVILRKTRGLTQDEFASAVGVSRQAVYKWESGQSYPEVQKLLEIKTLFSISIDNLLDDNYDVPLPEKKRKKRISKEAKEKIEKTVEKSEAPKAAAPKAEPVAVAEPVVEEQTDDTELIAILTAAIVAYESSNGNEVAPGGFRVVSFRRTNGGKAWNSK